MSKRWANNEHYEGTEVEGYWDMGLTLYRQLDVSSTLISRNDRRLMDMLRPLDKRM